MTDNRQPTHWTQTDLISERGWTQRLIDLYLVWPDTLEPNPHHDRGAPMRLFEVGRVLAVEATSEFLEDFARIEQHRAARRAGARQAAQTRRTRQHRQAAVGVHEITFTSSTGARR